MTRRLAGSNRFFTVAVLALLVLMIVISYAYSHEWYAPYCCNDKDCIEAKTGEVRPAAQGYWIVEINTVIPYHSDRIRVSQDDKFHVCQGFDMDDGHPNEKRSMKRGKWIRCLYVPVKGG